MCGIFGAIGNYDPHIVKMLALLNESRGRDSVGFYNGTDILKQACKASDIIKNPYLDSQYPYIMGHTRQATSGIVSSYNAHPYEYGNIIGSHNGIVTNYEALKTEHRVYASQVDSQIIFWGLDQFGLTWLNKLKAYWGLSWINKSLPNEFYLMSHNASLSICHTKEAIYYSSEGWDLKRVGLPYYNAKNDRLYIINIKELTINKFKVNGLQGTAYYDYRTNGSSYDSWKTKNHSSHNKHSPAKTWDYTKGVWTEKEPEPKIEETPLETDIVSSEDLPSAETIITLSQLREYNILKGVATRQGLDGLTEDELQKLCDLEDLYLAFKAGEYTFIPGNNKEKREGRFVKNDSKNLN